MNEMAPPTLPTLPTRPAPDAPEALSCDALAELFLGETDHPAAPYAVAAPTPTPTPANGHPRDQRDEHTPDEPAAIEVEAILAGHLPVLASAWVSQYARTVAARSAAPVGLIRITGDDVTVELVGKDVPTPDGAAPGAAPDAEAAIRRLRPLVQRWLIQSDGPTIGALLDGAGADRLTLLSGADEAALVAGYRLVKELLEPRLELAGPRIALRLHIAITGGAGPDAMAAAERLSSAAERFLGAETTVEVAAARIDAGRATLCFRGSAPDPALLVAAIRDEPAPDPEDVLEPAPAEMDGRALAGETTLICGPPISELNGLNGLHTPEHTAASAAFLADDAPRPAQDTAAETAPEPASAELHHLRCPWAPSITFRAECGRLVALADARAAGADAALRELTIATSWAAEHATLIAQATGLPAGLAQRILLVRDPAGVRRLLDADISVRVATDGRAEIPLN